MTNAPDLSALYDAFAAPLRGRLRRLTGDPDLAEDLLHESLLKAARGSVAVRDPSRLGGYVLRIAERTHLDRLRRKRELSPLPDDGGPAAPEAGGIATDGEPDLRTTLLCAIDLLPPDAAEALRLTAFSGLSQEDVARRLGLSSTGARSRVQRARAALRRLLTACCRFEFDGQGRVTDDSPTACSERSTPCCGDVPRAASALPQAGADRIEEPGT